MSGALEKGEDGLRERAKVSRLKVQDSTFRENRVPGPGFPIGLLLLKGPMALSSGGIGGGSGTLPPLGLAPNWRKLLFLQLLAWFNVHPGRMLGLRSGSERLKDSRGGLGV